MTGGRVDQPDPGNALRNHEQRIRALEANPGAGIRYDTDNTGDWLNVATTTVEPSTNAGIQFTATGVGTGDGAGIGMSAFWYSLYAHTEQILIGGFATGGVSGMQLLSSAADFSNPYGILIRADDTNDPNPIGIASNGDIDIQANDPSSGPQLGGSVNINTQKTADLDVGSATGGDVTIQLGAGKTFKILDHTGATLVTYTG
jgi:hypothetical protein